MASGLAYFPGMGMNDNRGGDGIGTGGLKRPLSFHFDYTDPADAGHAKILVVAKAGDMDASFPGGFENRGSTDDG